MHLKKWGKLKLDYKLLLDYSTVNDQKGAIIDYSTFGMAGGVLAEDGHIYKFDQYPVSSRITYGKVGYHRLGFTDYEGSIVHFKELCIGTLEVTGSLDGQNLAPAIYNVTPYDKVNTLMSNASLSARWYNLTFSGHFDITHLEFRGTKTARR